MFKKNQFNSIPWRHSVKVTVSFVACLHRVYKGDFLDNDWKRGEQEGDGRDLIWRIVRRVAKLATPDYNMLMRVISVKRLREFWQQYPDAEQPLRIWYGDVRRSTWRTPSDIKRSYSTASFLSGNRVVFNIRGNRYRLVVMVLYKGSIVFVRFVGTHEEYNRIDPEAI